MAFRSLAAILAYLRNLAVIAGALVVLFFIVLIASGIRDARPPHTDRPPPIPSSDAEAEWACHVYAYLKARVDQIERISGLIPPGELVTRARRQDYENRRDAAKRENAIRGLGMFLATGRSRPPVPLPIHPYFGEIAIRDLNDGRDLDTVCRRIHENVDYANSVRRVYQHYLEVRRATAEDPQQTATGSPPPRQLPISR